MKKNIMWVTTAFLTAAVVLVMLFALARAEVFADSYKTDLSAYEGEARVLTFGTEYDADAMTYYMIKPSKTGVITFAADYSGYTALCNSNGDPISYGSSQFGDSLNPTSTYAWAQSVSYGVKKGKTYYIRMDGFPYNKDEAGNYTAQVKWTNGKVKASKYGKKKSKAVAIKKKKTVKGLFTAGNKKGQWFKITNKQKKTIITLNAPKINDSIQFKFWYKSYGKWYTTTRTAYRSGEKIVLEGKTNKKAKHTYIIKVTPEYKTSGSYTIKWK